MNRLRWRLVFTVISLCAIIGVVILAKINYRPVAPCVESMEATHPEVCFQSGGDTLSGSIYLPPGDGPFPAVLLLHGSGKQPRLAQYAESLAADGLVVMTYDKRGTGRSGGRYCDGVNPFTGCFSTFTTELYRLADDASAAVDRLAEVPQVDPDALGLWGPSQGGWIAPVVAGMNGKVGFIVQHSAPAVTYNEEDAFSQFMRDYPQDDFPSDGEIQTVINAVERGGFDPRPHIEALDIPTLWLFGGQDRSLPVNQSIDNLGVWRPNDPQLTIKLYPSANHELQLPGETGSPAASIRSLWVDWVKALR